jgi:hypothetical protein
VKKSLEELEAVVEEAHRRLQRTGKTAPFYRHRKSGVEYVLDRVILRERDFKPLVVYRQRNKLLHLVFFARPLDEFLKKFDIVEER